MRFEELESRQLLSITLPTIGTQSLSAGAPLNLALNNTGSSGHVAYTASVTNSSLTSGTLTATVRQSNPSLKLSVSYTGSTTTTTDDISGDIVIQLFKDLAPNTVDKIMSLVNQGYYNGLTFHRIISDFMIQGGDPLGTGYGGPGFTFDDEFTSALQFTSSGLLAMANSGTDTNGSQFFITTEPYRQGDFEYTIFGMVTQGMSIVNKLDAVAADSSTGKPTYTVSITSASIINDTQDAVLWLSAPNGSTGTATVTITGTDTVTNETASQSFTVDVAADTTNDPPFLGTTTPIVTALNTAVTYQIPATDVEGDAITYAAALGTTNANISVSVSTSGLVTITPSNDVSGAYSLEVEVLRPNATSNTYDTEYIPLYINRAPVVATVASPSLGTAYSNVPKTISLTDFINNGSGTTIITDADTSAVKGGIALVGVTGSGTWKYSLDGASFIAVGTLSETSALLLPNTAELQYTPTGSAVETAKITYRAWDTTSGTSGTTVDTSTSGGTTAFSTAYDTASLTTTVNAAPVITTAAAPSLGSTTTGVTKAVSLATFIDNGTGTTIVTDADTGTVLGGIALYNTTGNGTWEYSIDGGTNYTAIGSSDLSATSALLLPSTAMLEFAPSGTAGGTATISYRAWDASSGTAGTKVDVSTNGNATAFSTITDTASLTVTANTAPVLTAATPAISLGSIAAGATKTFTLATYIKQVTTASATATTTTSIYDADTGATVGGIALFDATGGGVWSYSLDGTTFTAVGAISGTSALLLPKSATLKYDAGSTTNETPTISYRAWDTASGAAETKVDASTHGGNTAFSDATDTASLSVGKCSISGYVYVDADNDGKRVLGDKTHMGIQGAIVELQQKVSSTWTSVAKTMTDKNGLYQFNGLTEGTYRVIETQPGNYIDGKETVGKGATTGTAGTNQFDIGLSLNDNATEYNFGERGLKAKYITARMFMASAPPAEEYVADLNALPVVNLTTSVAGSGSIHVAGDASIAYNDNAKSKPSSLNWMTVTIVDPPATASETLVATIPSTSTIKSAYANGVLTLSGVATVSEYQSVLKTVVYSDSTGTYSGSRTIDIVTYDGIADSQTAVATLTVAPSPTCTITANDSLIDATESTKTGFTIVGAPVDSTTMTYSCTISSSGGGTPVTKTGTVTSATQSVTGIDVSSLKDGTLTFSVTLTKADKTGPVATATATLDTTAPTGYSISRSNAATNAATTGFTFAGAEVGATYNYTVSSYVSGTPVTGSGTITSATQTVTGINIANLPEGLVNFSVTLTDPAGNVGAAAQSSAMIDRTAPMGYSIVVGSTTISSTAKTSTSFTFAGAEPFATYSYTVTSTGGGTAVTGTGTITSATQQISSIDLSTLSAGTVTYKVTLTDPAGNTGMVVAATATLS